MSDELKAVLNAAGARLLVAKFEQEEARRKEIVNEKARLLSEENRRRITENIRDIVDQRYLPKIAATASRGGTQTYLEVSGADYSFLADCVVKELESLGYFINAKRKGTLHNGYEPYIEISVSW